MRGGEGPRWRLLALSAGGCTVLAARPRGRTGALGPAVEGILTEGGGRPVREICCKGSTGCEQGPWRAGARGGL